jgi:hypothetical protein
MFKILRIFILLVILLGVGLSSWRMQTRSVEWKRDLPVNLYLVNADGSEQTAAYLRGLSKDDFKTMERFMHDEAARLGQADKASIEIRMGGVVDEIPPEPPHGGNVMSVMLWSLKMRWWASNHGETHGSGTQVKMFLLYHDPALTNQVPHSTGLQKGLIGRVNLFASSQMAKQNLVVITHEFLHTLGATDKYDPATDQPLFPDGYAIPDQQPVLPQIFAEIMAGRTPISATNAVIPESLYDVLIGPATAREINWQ